MANRIESDEVLKESFSNTMQLFDLVLAKGFDKFNEIFEDKGMLPLIYITEWFRVWTIIIQKKLHPYYSQNLINYVNRASKFKLIKTGFDINLEMCGKENLKIFLALALYANTIPDNVEEDLLVEISSLNSLFVKVCLSCLNENQAVKFNKPLGFNGKVKIQHHVFWVLYLTPCHKFDESQSVDSIRKIENPLNLIKTLSNCLLNREFDDYCRQMEQDYLICNYLYYLFYEVDQMIKDKKISKIKVNSVLGKEIELIVQIAVNICKSFYLSEEGSQFSDITHEWCDVRVEHLIYIIVNISENPSDYTKYFNQTLVFELEGKGFSVIKHFVGIIKEIDEDVLTKLLDLSFKEELDKYQMFSILFKLVKESEDNEVLKSDSEISSHRSSDSMPPMSLLTSISSKKNIIIRALLLAIYKSCSVVDDIQVISKLFFNLFLPYAFTDAECKNEILNYLEETDESDDIDRILVRAIEIDERYR